MSKTLLMRQLAYEWATDRAKSFPLVLLVPLKNVDRRIVS